MNNIYESDTKNVSDQFENQILNTAAGFSGAPKNNRHLYTDAKREALSESASSTPLILDEKSKGQKNNDGVTEKPNWSLSRNQKSKDISNSELKNWMYEQFRDLSITVEDWSYQVQQSVEDISTEIEHLQDIQKGKFSAANPDNENMQLKDRLLDLYRILASQHGLCGYGSDDAIPFGEDNFDDIPF